MRTPPSWQSNDAMTDPVPARMDSIAMPFSLMVDRHTGQGAGLLLFDVGPQFGFGE